MRKNLAIMFGQALLVCVFVWASAGPARAQSDVEKLYKGKCGTCHGPDGKGSAMGLKLGVRDFQSPEVQKKTDAQLTEIITKGTKKMAGYDKKIPADQIKELASYCRDLGKK